MCVGLLEGWEDHLPHPPWLLLGSEPRPGLSGDCRLARLLRGGGREEVEEEGEEEGEERTGRGERGGGYEYVESGSFIKNTGSEFFIGFLILVKMRLFSKKF